MSQGKQGKQGRQFKVERKKKRSKSRSLTSFGMTAAGKERMQV
jgi:hypothetical protein